MPGRFSALFSLEEHYWLNIFDAHTHTGAAHSRQWLFIDFFRTSGFSEPSPDPKGVVGSQSISSEFSSFFFSCVEHLLTDSCVWGPTPNTEVHSANKLLRSIFLLNRWFEDATLYGGFRVCGFVCHQLFRTLWRLVFSRKRRIDSWEKEEAFPSAAFRLRVFEYCVTLVTCGCLLPGPSYRTSPPTDKLSTPGQCRVKVVIVLIFLYTEINFQSTFNFSLCYRLRNLPIF